MNIYTYTKVNANWFDCSDFSILPTLDDISPAPLVFGIFPCETYENASVSLIMNTLTGTSLHESKKRARKVMIMTDPYFIYDYWENTLKCKIN